nr:ABC transporter ATP-binding protein [Propionibacterium freudenreichii]
MLRNADSHIVCGYRPRTCRRHHDRTHCEGSGNQEDLYIRQGRPHCPGRRRLRRGTWRGGVDRRALGRRQDHRAAHHRRAVDPSAGRVEVAGQPVAGQPPEQVGLVFQDYGRPLLPWLSITGNVALPLRSKGVDLAGARTLALGALDAVGLAGRGKAHPRELSGGMQQRVAIARALAYEPQLLLMDEPFASVDAQTRMDLEDLVLPPRDQFGITVVIVTHDVDEAVYLSDRVIVLTPPPSVVSRIVEVDLPKPRDQQRTKDDVRFARLRGEVLDLVRGREPEARAA